MSDNYPLDNAELTPDTREEHFLDGATDLEPITRKEAFIARIYDSSQVVPEHIETREEWFLNKAAEGGGGVTIEALSVTENGIYSEIGKAYSPVTVNVPLPTNANERQSVTSYPVTDSANYPLPKCDVTVTDADKCEVIVTTDNTITEDSGVYIERQSGGGNRELDEIVGGTVVWNQLAVMRSTDMSTIKYDITFTDNRDDSFKLNGTASASGNIDCIANVPVINGHRYLIRSGYYDLCMTDTQSYSTAKGDRILNATSSTSRVFNYYVREGQAFDNVTAHPQIIDLTQAFGTTIADYVYSLEQSTAGSGIAWLRSYGYLTEDYYGYTANKIESVSVARHITRGVNQWDEEWESGSIDNSGGLVVNPNYIRSKNYINTKPSTNYNFIKPYNIYTKLFYYGENNQYISYYELTGQSATNLFTTPSDCYYMKFVQYRTTYNDDVSINYPSTDTSYHAYHEPNEYPYPPITLRGIPKLTNGELTYDGDTLESTGRVKRKYGVVDLGTLDWYSMGDVEKGYYTDAIFDQTAINSICSNYTYVDGSNIYDGSAANKTFGFYGGSPLLRLRVKDTAYTDATTFKAAMSGVYLVYEKATPTTEYTSPFATTQVVDADGTEEYIDAGVEAGTRDVAIPVGHNTKYFNGEAYLKTFDTTSGVIHMADEGIMPTSPMYIEANGSVDVEYWKSNS